MHEALCLSSLFLFIAMAVPREMEAYPSETVVHAAPRDFADARAENLSPAPYEFGLLELTRAKRLDQVVLRRGLLESATVWARFPFDELVASANCETPLDTAFEIEVQVRFPDSEPPVWSPWFHMGRFEPSGRSASGEKTEETFGKVEVDTLQLSKPADAFRYRLSLESRDPEVSPVLRLAAVVYTDRSGRAPSQASPPDARKNSHPAWGRELNVVKRSQMTEQATYARDICSPTSLAMALHYWKVPLTTAETVVAVVDTRAGIYGNWFFNVAFAGSKGLAAFVTRLNSMQELEAEIAGGRPVAVSISFGPGELDGAPLKKTRGHLLVVRGFDRRGNVIVNDPAAPQARSARRIYKREQFAKVWLGKKFGLAYRISPLWPRPMKVAVPVAHLRKEPAFSLNDAPGRDHLEQSQLLYGERVLAQKAQGDWVRVEAGEQAAFGRKWTGYPGWVSAKDLVWDDSEPGANAVVQEKTVFAVSLDGNEKLPLSLGTKLRVETREAGSWAFFSPRTGWMTLPENAARRLEELPETQRRDKIVETARKFLGDPYFFGGRSSPGLEGGGVDCSGLVNLSYQVAGMDIPRDARDQHRRAKKIKKSGLKTGDLVFISSGAAPGKIDHVMLYTGGGKVIEATSEAGVVRELPLEEKVKRPWKELEHGAKAGKRRIYFGTFF